MEGKSPKAFERVKMRLLNAEESLSDDSLKSPVPCKYKAFHRNLDTSVEPPMHRLSFNVNLTDANQKWTSGLIPNDILPRVDMTHKAGGFLNLPTQFSPSKEPSWSDQEISEGKNFKLTL